MSDPHVANTIEAAVLSAGSRGAISVIDRLQFGIRRKGISMTNIHNNLAAIFVALIFAWGLGKLSDIPGQFFDIRVFVFGGLLQISAQGFSYAFRHMKVPSIIVVTKFADIFVGPLIFMIFARWSWADFSFAAATSIGCFMIFFGDGIRSLHLRASAAVCGVLIIQGGLSPWYMGGLTSGHVHWLPFTCALLLWRLLFSLGFCGGELRSFHRSFRGHDQEYWLLHSARAGLTLSAQIFQVLALSMDRPVIAWPILNAAGLFSVIFSIYLLRERASKREALAFIFLALIGIVRLAL